MGLLEELGQVSLNVTGAGMDTLQAALAQVVRHTHTSWGLICETSSRHTPAGGRRANGAMCDWVVVCRRLGAWSG